MARRPDCAKFVSYGEPNIDDVTADVNGAELALSGTMTLPCEQCGADLSACDLSAEIDLEDRFPALPPGHTAEYEIADQTSEATDRTETHDRQGNPIKNHRYARRYYGVSIECQVTRTVSDPDGNPVGEPDEETITIAAEEQASSFDSLN